MAKSFLDKLLGSLFDREGDGPPIPREKPPANVGTKTRMPVMTANVSPDADIDWMARTIFGEASSANQPYEGQVGVGHVIRNRMLDKGMDAKSVVLEEGQFDSWKNPVTRPAMEALGGSDLEYYKDVARKVLEGQVDDPTGGARHFFNPEGKKLEDLQKWQRLGRTTMNTGSYPFNHIFRAGVDDMPRHIPGQSRVPAQKPKK
jgi:spore germination cell wall hydrolase CwlJ-like protein